VTVPTIRIRKLGITWSFNCQVCINQPGIAGIQTWQLALLYAEEHMTDWHPIVNWDKELELL
jgi:hypothetical protein